MRKFLLLLTILFSVYYVFFFDFLLNGTEMLFKLIPMLLLLIYAILSPYNHKAYYLYICCGLLFCAIGDYTLQWFIIGLISFLIGHIFYIFAFSHGKTAVPMLIKIGLLLYGVGMAIWMSTALLNRAETVLAIAVMAYISVILTMGWMAIRTRIPYAIVGAGLFIISDSILAINRFITSVPYAHELIMLTYYSAQIFITLSISKYLEIRNKVIK